MAPKPFIRLAARRVVNRPDLPADLAEFYAWNEGVGLESDCAHYPVRLCKLDEVVCGGWKDLDLGDDIPEGWEEFAGCRIGIGMFSMEEIVRVLNAPSCPSGSILAIGRDVAGPGGDGPYALESSLVLATSFPDWLAHLERWGWVEHAVAGWEAQVDIQEIDRYYLALNPRINLGREERGTETERPHD
jgi:hypothetical protein